MSFDSDLRNVSEVSWISITVSWQYHLTVVFTWRIRVKARRAWSRLQGAVKHCDEFQNQVVIDHETGGEMCIVMGKHRIHITTCPHSVDSSLQPFQASHIKMPEVQFVVDHTLSVKKWAWLWPSTCDLSPFLSDWNLVSAIQHSASLSYKKKLVILKKFTLCQKFTLRQLSKIWRSVWTCRKRCSQTRK